MQAHTTRVRAGTAASGGQPAAAVRAAHRELSSMNSPRPGAGGCRYSASISARFSLPTLRMRLATCVRGAAGRKPAEPGQTQAAVAACNRVQAGSRDASSRLTCKRSGAPRRALLRTQSTHHPAPGAPSTHLALLGAQVVRAPLGVDREVGVLDHALTRPQHLRPAARTRRPADLGRLWVQLLRGGGRLLGALQVGGRCCGLQPPSAE